jgi:hypothetical protein
MLPSHCIWRNTSTHAAKSCILLVAGHLFPDTFTTTGVGETQLPSLDERMNHEKDAQMSTWAKDVPI